MPLCGPRLSYFSLTLSIWGILQLALTGLCLHFRSVAFVDDVTSQGHTESNVSSEELASRLEEDYSKGELNCWVAALLYVVTLCFSVQQVWMNQRVKEIESEQFQ